MSLSRATVPFHRNPSLRPGLAALDAWLAEGEYTANARGRVVAYTAANGTPTGCIELDPSDEYGANSVFCDAMDLVPYSAESWSDESVPLDVAMLAAGTHPVPFHVVPPELEPDDFDGPDAPDAGMSRSAALGELIRTGSVRALPPIAGGSPDAAPFEPSPEDWADYSRWSRELEARYAAAEAGRPPTAAEVRAWLDDHEHDRPTV